MTAPLADHQIIRGGLLVDIQRKQTTAADLLIAGDRIAAIGPPGLDAPESAVAIDASDRLIMPGLINAHTHGHGSLGKGLGDRWSLELLLNGSPWISGGYALEDKQTAALLNATELVMKGCTAAYDMYFEFPTASLDGLTAVAEAYAKVGPRLVLAPMMGDMTFHRAVPGLLDSLPDPHRRRAEKIVAADSAAHLAACAELLQGWPLDRERARPALGPTIPLHCSDTFMLGCRDLAEDYDVRLQMHLGESKAQAVAGLERYGTTLAGHLDRLGLIGPRFTGAHGVWLDQDDVKRFADRGATIAHNPGSNLRLGAGVAPARAILDAGVGVGIGSDGSSSSDNQNMFEAMRAAAFVSRLHDPDPERWLGTWEVLKAATAGSAAVLGMADEIGRLAPGYKADLVLLDLGNPNFVPLNDAANQIINAEDSSAIDSVMIGGRMVLNNRRFTDFDYPALRQRAARTVERLRAATAEARTHMEAMAPYVARHCTGLVCRHYHVARRIDGGSH